MAAGGGTDLCHLLAEDTTAGTLSGFLSAVYVWIYRPNVINKRIQYVDIRQRKEEGNLVHLIRDIIPKSDKQTLGNDTVCIDSFSGTVTFIPHQSNSDYHSYQFRYSSNEPKISIYLSPSSDSTKNLGVVHPKREWLKSTLLPKICKWAEQEIDSKAPPTLGTDGVISMKRYCSLYKELKSKYGPPLIKNWTESTDPYKFVYEDVAIATYLLVLWEEERSRCGLTKKQTFVDIGCGNGLLVYILSSEGHEGKGIDLRERRIWKLFRSVATLEVLTLTPSSTTCFPEFDWLIGNHSDELTPWIPVMAARSSYNTRYFVIPCCSFDFDKKFCRDTSSLSQYRSYLNYITEVGIAMGFNVLEDVLRIPSSKRVCLIGQNRNYLPEEEIKMEERRISFIKSRCSIPTPIDSVVSSSFSSSNGRSHDESCDRSPPPADIWAEGFKPRPTLEDVKNCSRVERSVKDGIVAMVTSALLAPPPNWILVMEGSDEERLWNKGGKVSLSHIATSLLSERLLTALKKECGGLHTLLRNHCQIFEVLKGMVGLRDWSNLEHPVSIRYKSRLWKQNESQLLHKTKRCWFHDNHPQGCPRSSVDCPYAHGPAELRKRPDFKSYGEKAEVTHFNEF